MGQLSKVVEPVILPTCGESPSTVDEDLSDTWEEELDIEVVEPSPIYLPGIFLAGHKRHLYGFL